MKDDESAEVTPNAASGCPATPCSDFLDWFHGSPWSGAGKDAGELAEAAWNAAKESFAGGTRRADYCGQELYVDWFPELFRASTIFEPESFEVGTEITIEHLGKRQISKIERAPMVTYLFLNPNANCPETATTDACGCCERAGEYNGFASGSLSFVCPLHCPCHD